MKAFPQLAHWEINERNGMDLRDYFAAQMMPRFSFHPSKENDAKEIYKIADAMMKARKEKSE